MGPDLATGLTRRSAAALVVLVLAAAAALAGCGAGSFGEITEQEAVRPLAVPPLLTGKPGPDGTLAYSLTAQAGRTDFGMGGPAATIGLNGSYLGPTLRMTRGTRVRVEVRNTLAEMTTVHWHGMHVPARMDGGPHQMIDPNQTWRPTWSIDQPAATLWYHAHPHGQTAQQVYRGLAGMLLIDDPSGGAGLPHEYGVDDIPLIVQDKSFTPAGDLVVDPEGQASTGFLGDTVLANGTVGAYFDSDRSLLRLRLLNASNARVYNFGFSDDRPFQMIASDGGLLPAPLLRDRIQLSPGERAEILVGLRPGEVVDLVSHPPDLGSRVGPGHHFGTGSFRVLQLRAAASLTGAGAPPARLAEVPAPDADASQRTRVFRISGRAVNGRPMDLGRIDEMVPVGQVETWELINQDPQPHNFHAHNVQFQVLDVDGGPPGEELRGWKDTVYLPPRTTVRIQLKFTDYSDPSWPYMFHCHLLWHEDLGIMGQFVVVEPGQSAGSPPDSSTSGSGSARSPAMSP